MLISPAEAVRQYDVSKPTLYSDMKEGKLSYKIDDRKKRKIDVAELERLYEKRAVTKTAKNVKSSSENTDSNVKLDQSKIDLLEQEIRFLKQQVEVKAEQEEKWQAAFEKAQQTADRVTALLTDQTKEKDQRAGDQEKKYDDLMKANELLRKQNRRVLYELKAQKELSLWERVFGKKEKPSGNRRAG
jgi:Mg-chelatase subunit ChlI